MLSKVPAIPNDRLCQIYQRMPVRKTVDRYVLCVHGYSTWEVPRNATYDLNGRIKDAQRRPLSLGVERATSVVLNNIIFQRWPGVGNKKDCTGKGNFIAIITLGLVYVFFQRLIELQGLVIAENGVKLDSGYVVYIDEATANSNNHTDDGSESIAIGDMTDDVARW